MNVKHCGVCGEEKPLSSFTKRSGRGGRRGTCRSCQRKRQRGAAVSAVEDEEESASPALADLGTEESSSRTVRGAADMKDMPEEPPKRKRRRRARRKRKQTGEGGAEERLSSALLGKEEEPEASSDELEQELGRSNDGPPKRKRNRKRRKRRRPDEAKELLTSGLEKQALQPDESIEPLVPTTELPNQSGEELSGQTAETNGHIIGESLPKRKRKRKRRRKRKSMNAILTDEAERPPVRPPYKRIVPIKGKFIYDTRVLNDRGTGLIRLRGRRETGKRWSTEIPTEMAVRMVNEGAAGIINPSLIHKLYTKTDFRLYILQRDDYVCKYCGRFGDTIDHVMPKSKGGLSTPANCVCACAECNLKKADHLDFVFDDL
ncbi:HNH endonuclease [Paenibacillus spongiae]|uniref:HNH endonuclease n=1 Tax=Paenibacillus spongiae TaxID=2909671 RepID=A0ABY5SGR9_9BACL|nr:HNH endonuclease signature motif containing protein [Paenibacillus spongiae]UVI31680.1 HNH endonuclease [Paenibacillus spongiae]